LTSLDIWMHVVDLRGRGGGDDDWMEFFKTILEACPGLVDFHFMCTTSFTVAPLTHFLSYLHLLPRLKRFSLTKGHKYGDEAMLSTVLRIFKSCPKLIQVNIRWARERCLNHLKQEGVYDVIEWEDGKGTVEGRPPKTLMVFERGIPLIGKPFSRRYKYVFPGSAGGTGKRGLPLMGGEGSGWRWGRRRPAVSNVTGGSDTVEDVVGTTSPADVVNESISSNTEVDTDTEVEAERDSEGEEEENIRVNTSVKGKEVKRIGLPTPTN